ncbi:hypothetical protein, partial [Serratia marcescens]|uniref:hypothetical protein n=1 Tax=Serratia marcescens TaxID=615 RepID=UPI001953180D
MSFVARRAALFDAMLRSERPFLEINIEKFDLVLAGLVPIGAKIRSLVESFGAIGGALARATGMIVVMGGRG